MELSLSDPIDVCIVVPPFEGAHAPSMGPSVLVAACRARGLKVKLVYGTLDLAARIGFESFQKIVFSSTSAFLGDQIFRPVAYSSDVDCRLPDRASLPQDDRVLLDRVTPHAGPLLDDLAAEILAYRPRIVGFSSTFQQNMATAGLARRIREISPETILVMGGANTMGEMGKGVAATFPWIDHVFSGEADIAFPDFCERYLRDGTRPDSRIVHCPPIYDFRHVSGPDFSDYFAALRRYQGDGTLPADLPNYLPMESSRGCWWGQKNHCTFCGLNGEGMEFRQKPADRVFAEVEELTGAWGAKMFALTDNIMPLSYFKTLLPRLEEWPDRPALFYEVKANLPPAQIETMSRAGIDQIQPGIESLSTAILKLMNKGVSGGQNLALLRSCRAAGIRVVWNYLFGFPGERLDDYERVLSMLPKLEHLNPPSGLHRLIIDRFSPYHDTPEKYGIKSIKPLDGYHFLYPPGAPVSQIAYHFSGEFETELQQRPDVIERFRRAIAVWRESWSGNAVLPILRAVDTGASDVAVIDTRRIAKQKLTTLPRTMYQTMRHLERPRGRESLSPDMDAHIEYLLERNFIVDHDGALVNLVTMPRTVATRAEAPVEESIAVD